MHCNAQNTLYGAAYDAGKKCFNAWLENFGSGDRETTRLLSQVRLFFEMHGASRFQDVNDSSDSNIRDRAGFKEIEGIRGDMSSVLKYYLLPETFKAEVCKGFDLKTAKKILIDAGWIVPDKNGNPTQKPYIGAVKGQPRIYVFNSEKIWNHDD